MCSVYGVPAILFIMRPYFIYFFTIKKYVQMHDKVSFSADFRAIDLISQLYLLSLQVTM
jgi:hypothetical protein